MQNLELEHVHKDIIEIKRDLSVIKHILSQERELSDWAKEELENARAEPESETMSIEDV